MLLWAYNLYALAWVIVLLLLLFPIALFLLPIKKTVCTNGFYTVCRAFAKLWFIVTGMKYQEIGKDTNNHDQEQPFIYVANHRSYIDILLMLASMDRPYRPLGKEEMSRIPLFGYFYRRIIIMVERNRAMSRSKSYMGLKRVLEKNISVFIFPEGTFNEFESPLKSFYNGAFQLAIKKRINIKPIVFVDSIHRMHYDNVFTMRPGICRVLFLEEIDINNYMPGKHVELKNDVYERMYSVLTDYNGKCPKFR